MSIFVYFAALLAAVNCAGMLSPGFAPWHAPVLAVVIIFAALGIWKPGQDKLDGRVVSVMAIVLGVLPLLKGPIHTLRWTLKERAYAKQIAPLWQEWDSRTKTFANQMEAWHASRKYFPLFEGLAPIEDTSTSSASASARSTAGAELALPYDPFQDSSQPTRYWTDCRQFWVLVSHGPDKAFDLNIPPPLRPNDQADWRGRWIFSNSENPALLRYDPTNGSLGKGDVVFLGSGKEAEDDFFAQLGTAWNDAMEGYANATIGSDACQRAAAASAILLDKGKPASALAAATYSIHQIPRLLVDQKPPHDYLGWRMAGECLYALGDPRMAANAFVKYIDLNPNDTRAHFYLAASLYLSGDLVQARQEFSAAAQIDPKHPLAQTATQALQALREGRPPRIPSPGAPPPPPAGPPGSNAAGRFGGTAPFQQSAGKTPN